MAALADSHVADLQVADSQMIDSRVVVWSLGASPAVLGWAAGPHRSPVETEGAR